MPLKNKENRTQNQDAPSTIAPISNGDPAPPIEQWIYVHSVAKQFTQDKMLNKKCRKYEEKLRYLHDGLHLPNQVLRKCTSRSGAKNTKKYRTSMM